MLDVILIKGVCMFTVKLTRIESGSGGKLGHKKIAEYKKARKVLKGLGYRDKLESEELKRAYDYISKSVKSTRSVFKGSNKHVLNVCVETERKYPAINTEGTSFTLKKFKSEASFASYQDVKVGLISLKSAVRACVSQSRAMARDVLREDRITNNSVTHDGESFSWQLLAGCHTTPGKFLEIKRFTSVKKVFTAKKPKTNLPHVGIELEFFCRLDRNSLAQKLFDAELTPYVELKSDGSIKEFDTSKYFAHELCVLATEAEYKDVIKRVTEVLASTEAKINKSCGMHVHLDMRHRNKDVVFANLVSAQPQLYAMNPVSRETGTFSRKTESRQFEIANQASGRYFGINPASFSRHKTIEVRIHSGTVDFRKITAWVDILIAIVNKSEDVGVAARSVDGFINKFGIPSELKGYIEERITKFKKQRSGEVIEEEVA